jgi:hypothetical protein
MLRKVLLLVGLLLLAAPGVASAGTITAVGSVQIPVTPSDPKNNASIKDAIEKAQSEGYPKAVAAARTEAQELAEASHLTLGALQSVDENIGGPGYYGIGFYSPFGQDKFCGTVTRVHRHKTKSGKTVRTRTKVRRCYFTRILPVQLAVTFEATPAS